MPALVRSVHVGLFLALLAATPALAATPKIVVRGAGSDLNATPLVVAMDQELEAGDYLLQPGNGGKPISANVFEDGGKTYLAFVLDRIGSREARVFTLQRASESSSGDTAIRLIPEDGDVVVQVGGQPFTRHINNGGPKPYMYPVIGPTGVSYTRAYPMEQVEGEDKDHPHQRSFWFTHGNVNGYDFWASDPLNRPNPKFGSIQETARKTVVSGAGAGVLRTTNAWLDPSGKILCEDERVFCFTATKHARFVDVDVTIKATHGPVTFGDTKEGMFGLRVASSMDVKRKTGGRIVNAEGITDLNAWGKASPWVDYTGPIAGQTVGVAILNHPESFRYPTTWHVRDYGLFAANPFGYHDFGQKTSGEHTIPDGQSIHFRYRVILHEGDTTSADIPTAFKGFANPPKVEIQKD